MLKRNRLFLLLIPCFFFCLVLFHKPILCIIIKQIAIKKSPFFHGSDFSYKQLGYNKGSLYLEDLQITHPQFSNQQFSIQKVEYNFQFFPSSCHCESSYLLIEPTIKLNLSAKKNQIEQLNLYNLGGFLSFLKQVNIEKGRIEIYSPLLDGYAFFSFIAPKEKGHLGRIMVGLDPLQLDAYQISLDLYRNDLELFIKAQVDTVSIDVLSRCFFSIEELNLFKIKEGTAQGIIELSLDKKGHVKSFKQDLEVKDILVADEGKNITGRIPTIHIQSELPFQLEKSFEIKDLFSLDGGSKLISSLELSQGDIVFMSDTAKTIWKIEDLYLKTELKASMHPEMKVSGQIKKGDKNIPFCFQGKGVISSLDAWGLDLHNTCSDEEKQKKCSLISLSSLSHNEFLFSSNFECLDHHDLQIIQDLLVIKNPTFQKVNVNRGELQGDFKLLIKNGKLETMTLDRLLFSNISIRGLEDDWQLDCKQVEGKVKVQFPFLNEQTSSLYEIMFSEAFFEKKASEAERIEGDGFLCYQDFKLAPSSIKIKSNGIEINSNFSGPFSEITTVSQIEFSSTHKFSQLQDKVTSKSVQIEKLKKIDFSCKIRKEKNSLNILGNCLFNYSQEIQDYLDFGLEFSLHELDRYYSLVDQVLFERAWFDSDKVSPDTYLWFLEYYHQKWHVFGEVKAKGSVDRNQLSFQIEAEEAVYDSEDLLVTLPKSEESHKGFFIFDFKNKKWLIDLPIKMAKCVEKKFHMPFEKVSTRVTIEGTSLIADQISAECEQVKFKGQIRVDFKNPEWIDLQIYPSVMEGEIRNFISFIGYIPEFQGLKESLPSSGFVIGGEGNYFFTQYSPKASEKQAKIALKVSDTTYTIRPGCEFKKVEFDLHWDSLASFLEIKDFKGIVDLRKEQETRQYTLNAQQLVCKNLLDQEWNFDLRVEGATFDVLRIAGRTKKQGEDLLVEFKPNSNQFFGAKLEIFDCVLDSNYHLKTCKISSEFSFKELIKQWQCCYLTGFFEVDPMLFQKIKNVRVEGNLSLNMNYLGEDNSLELLVGGHGLVFDQKTLGDVNINFLKTSKSFLLKKFEFNNVSLKAKAHLSEKSDLTAEWEVDNLEGFFKHCFFKINKGSLVEKRVILDFEKVEVLLEEISESILLPKAYLPFLTGILESKGRLMIDFKEGLKNFKAQGELQLFSQNITSGGFEIQTKVPAICSFTLKEGLQLQQLHLSVLKKDIEETWMSFDVKEFRLFGHDKSTIAKGVKLFLPPEMFRYLIDQKMIPFMTVKEGQIILGDKSFYWDNQIETEFDFIFDQNVMQIQGVVKDGYYWIAEESIYLQKFYYFLDQGQLNVIFGFDYKDVSLDILTKIQLKDELEVKLIVKEGHLEGVLNENDARTSLDIQCKSSAEEGLYIQSIEGLLYGLEVAFRRNPRAYAPYVIMLTGQMKIDTAGLVKAFPKLFYQTIKDLGMGSGYELSGDWVISKKELKNSYFKGFLKGRDFEFLGFYFKTLMSEVEVNTRSVTIHDFSLSDLSGVLQTKEVKIYKDEDKKWKIKIPEVTVQDFRPSFLKKNEFHEEKIKPFIIKDLHFFNIEGIIGSKESVRGRGYFDFINTFKREMNILDIPIEIMGRLGFDLGIFVPVVGKLEFEMTEGKIFLRELKHAYSEGKRSRFYLSGYKDSYIGLDGNLFIDIKMKQYVLLKITEPFTLSIRGSLSKPRYSLR